MPTLTVALPYDGDSHSIALADSLAEHPAVTRLFLISHRSVDLNSLSRLGKSKAAVVLIDFMSGTCINHLVQATTTDYLLAVLPGEAVRLKESADDADYTAEEMLERPGGVRVGQRTIESMLAVAEDTAAGLIYSDFKDDLGDQAVDHPLIDYQAGSIRDSFDFGPIFLISRRAADFAFKRHGPANESLRYAGLYDLRLKLSIDSKVLRIPEPLYTRVPFDRRASGERQFDYVDPRRRAYQIEMEQVATEHLKRVGAYLASDFRPLPRNEESFPVRASVVIPVRNRERTIKEAVLSALSQQPGFEFNVIVVDNHSTDRTTEILEELAASNRRLVHLKPGRSDLGIGGCWNEAIYSAHCGEYAAQLDSDDLYKDQHTLEKIVTKFQEGQYAMVIASYTIVDFELQELPPGLIDHREWTRDNGRNNALRINGLGAPRAFYVPVLRQIGFPNVSYGEDYSVALRISRDYEIGRIYESVYFARRWEGNSDAALPLTTSNRYDAYKDHLRTVEITARRKINQR